MLLALVTLVTVIGMARPLAASMDNPVADFLYRIAQELRQAGRTDDAEHELRKLLILAPDHAGAQRELAAIEGERRSRRHAIDDAFQRLVQQRQQARQAAVEEALRQVQGPAAAGPVPVAPPTPVSSAPSATAAPSLSAASPSGQPPAAPPFGFISSLTPPEETRPEILSDTKRAGFQKLYKEGIGFQPVRGLGFSARTEIFEEPNPVDDYILESKILNFSEISQFRRSLTPLFTRAWAVRTVADYEPLPRFTYEYDERDIEHEFETRYSFKNRHLRTHALNALYSFGRIPLVGLVTLNPWYKRVLQDSDSDLGSYEHKDEFIVNLSLQPTENLEYFFQYDTYDSDKTRTLGASKLQLFKAQVRMRFPQWKLFVIPSVEYSDTDFDPSDDEFTKRDLFVDWGFDITPRLRASSKEQWVYTKLSQPAVTSGPTNPDAQAFATTNTLSYELFKDFDVSLGLDHARGFGYSHFNNVGFRAEMEFFKPGILRAKLGYEWLTYYNISDDLSLLYLRIFLFQ